MKLILTKKEVEMLVVWCRDYLATGDSKKEIKVEEDYHRLADKIKRQEVLK